MIDVITSPNNSKIKLVRSLQERRHTRDSESRFVAEGVRLLEEAVSVDWPLEFVLYDQSLSERGFNLISELTAKPQTQISQITPELMASISDTETPQGILAVLDRKVLAISENPSLIILADQLRDPGNMGTLLRTAEAVGSDGVILTPGTVDAFSPKVIRAGMGAHFHLPIQQRTWQEVKSYLRDLPIFLADAQRGIPLWQANFKAPCALLIGGEAFGASTNGQALATQYVTIPMIGRVESLNAAIAAAILMGEVLRQRNTFYKE